MFIHALTYMYKILLISLFFSSGIPSENVTEKMMETDSIPDELSAASQTKLVMIEKELKDAKDNIEVLKKENNQLKEKLSISKKRK